MRSDTSDDLGDVRARGILYGTYQAHNFNLRWEYLLTSCAYSYMVYSVQHGTCVGSLEFKADERKFWRWLDPPRKDSSRTEFILLSGGRLTRYNAGVLPRDTRPAGSFAV